MVTLPTKQYVDNKDEIYLDISNTIPDLSAYRGKSVHMSNSESITLNGITVAPWCSWFIPYVTNTDFAGYIAYPNASSFYILGHTKNGYYIHQVY